tara:strand:- start:6090 stop:6203 length:114 start_codon:yes stop_codon:yes gene_type:complete
MRTGQHRHGKLTRGIAGTVPASRSGANILNIARRKKP